MIDKFITFKEPCVIEDDEDRKGGIIFRSHAVLTNGEHILISDAKHGEGYAAIDETLAFKCDDDGNVVEWSEIAGGRGLRTEDVVNELNSN